MQIASRTEVQELHKGAFQCLIKKKKKKDIKPHLDLSYILHLKANNVKDKLSQGRK